jgi:hypothetical protein
VAGHVLRSDEVRLEGQLSLSMLSSKPRHINGADITGAQTARIVESHPDFAVIEVTCSCGATMYLKCEHTEIGPPANEPNPVSQ